MGVQWAAIINAMQNEQRKSTQPLNVCDTHSKIDMTAKTGKILLFPLFIAKTITNAVARAG